MRDETLARLLEDFVYVPKSAVDEITPTVLHHTLDSQSFLRNRGYLSVGELFVKCVDAHVASGSYFWLNLESGDWDLHFYTLERYRRQGMATALFHDGVLPWLRRNKFNGERISTTALSTESIGLLKRLGFNLDGARYGYVVERVGEEMAVAAKRLML